MDISMALDTRCHGAPITLPTAAASSTSLMFNLLYLWGGLRTLGLEAWGSARNLSTGDVTTYGMSLGGPGSDAYVFYFLLSYNEETGEATEYNPEFIENIWEQPLAANQFLLRLTIAWAPVPNAGFYRARVPQIFATNGGTFEWRNQNYTTYQNPEWGLCFEFSAANSPKVKALTMRIAGYGNKPVTAANSCVMYLDDLEMQPLGAGGPLANTAANTKTIQVIDPIGLLYKSAGGGLYQINPSNYVLRSELGELINRVTALEENTDG